MQELEEQDIDPLITSVTQWELDPGCRMAYVNQTLYVNGERIGDQTPADLLHLANTRTIQSNDIRKLEGLWATPSSTSSDLNRSYRPRTTVHEVSWATARNALQSIRTRVFIEEQQIDPADEWDPTDQDAIHLLAERDGEPAGCARVLDLKKIGRMAVLKDVRHKNVGSKLLRAAISKIQSAGNTPTLGAQITAMRFYANHFLPEGPIFNDAHIPHRTMTLTGDPEKNIDAPGCGIAPFRYTNLTGRD